MNFQLALSWRFFEPDLVSFAPAGRATGNYLVRPTNRVCVDAPAALTLVRAEITEDVELEVPPELCVFILRSRLLMSDRRARRLSIFGVRHHETFYGRPVVTRVRAVSACLVDFDEAPFGGAVNLSLGPTDQSSLIGQR